jgi:anthranilate synthase/indole-3-glycerol phosphate synthase/phosphoribosylanthranilate isomerase
MPDILETICAQRRLDVVAARASAPEESLLARAAALHAAPRLDLAALLARSALVVAAEFKRASPSKGALAPPGADAAAAAAAYAAGGARVLSVLTEPSWFKGSLDDLERAAAAAAAAAPGGERALLLRKEFVVDAYQLAEARAFGADSVLLIVAALPTVAELAPLVARSRELGMEPLVEVNSEAELDVALAAGARCVGINNRNLRTFEVDLGTTVRVVAAAARRAAADPAAAPVHMLSLSGIRSADDVELLVRDCVGACAAFDVGAGAGAVPAGLRVMRGFLVGEALMRADDPAAMVRGLVDAAAAALARSLVSAASSVSVLPSLSAAGVAASVASVAGTETATVPTATLWEGRLASPPSSLLVKICGVRSAADALHAARSGADLIGMIFAPGGPRTVSPADAASVTRALRAFREQDPTPQLQRLSALGGTEGPERLLEARALLCAAARRARPLSVGVFLDAPPAAVLSAAAEAGLDLVQLHGDEDPGAFAAARAAADERAGAGSSFPFFPPIVKVVHVPVPLPEDASVRAAVVARVAARAAAWSGVAAALLVDSKQAAGGSGGGTGAAFDHDAFFSLLDAELGGGGAGGAGPSAGAGATDARLPLLIAGGLTPSSVAPLLARLRGCAAGGRAGVVGVDVSSGVEGDVKGVKDAGKVAAFVAAARARVT